MSRTQIEAAAWKWRPNIVRWEVNSTTFCMSKCLFTFWNNFVTFTKWSFAFTVHVLSCQTACTRDLQTQNCAYMPPSNKSRTWTQAAPKSWKIAHKLRAFIHNFTGIGYELRLWDWQWELHMRCKHACMRPVPSTCTSYNMNYICISTLSRPGLSDGHNVSQLWC